MLTVEEPKVPVEENNNSSKQAEVQKTEAQISEKDTNKAINIEKVKEEIEETKQKIEELDIHKDDKESNDNDNDDDDIVIPPPPEFSVPLFTKYIHGRQRSISVSSELSLDSYIDEEGIGSPNLDSSSESVINADGESAVTTEISADVPVHEAIDVPKPVHEEEDKEKEKNNDTNKEIPKDIQASTPSKIEEVATEPVKIEAPVVEESKKDSSLTIETDESHLNVANHVPPPRSSASLSASVTRQEAVVKKIQEEKKIEKTEEPQEPSKTEELEKRKRSSFKNYFFGSTSSNVSTVSNSSSTSDKSSKAAKRKSSSSLMSYVGSFLKKKNSYFDTDEEFWEAFLKEYKKDYQLDVNSLSTDGSNNKFGDLVERVQRGVPAEHRGQIWLSISDSLDAHLDVLYWQLLNEHCSYERAINQDLGRTFPEIPMFKTEEVRKQLYNIMKAYSIYDSEVGYCQGISFIAGLFLIQNMKEELAFTIFVRLMESYNLRTLFTPKMPGLMLLIYQFNAIFQTYIPALYFHFYRYNLSPMMYASQWFLTLFSYSFNVDLVFRIVDMILVEGPISVLLRFALVMLKRYEDELLSIEKFDSLMDFLKSDQFTKVNDVEQMVKEVIDLKKIVSDNRLEQLRLEHLEEIKKREPAQREMEQLRETMKLLRKENKEYINKIAENKKIQQALTDEIVLLKELVKDLQEDNEAVKMQVKDLRTIITQEEKIKDDDRLITLEEELQFLKDKLRATQVELCQSRMQYNELETAYHLEQERWKKSKRRLSRKIQLNEDKSKRTSYMIDPPSTPATPTSMKPIELPSITE
jgi:hypothetical protein